MKGMILQLIVVASGVSSFVVRTLWASERSLHSRRSVIFNQCRDGRMGVMWLDLGALTTARAREFWICWSRVIWNLGRLGRIGHMLPTHQRAALGGKVCYLPLSCCRYSVAKHDNWACWLGVSMMWRNICQYSSDFCVTSNCVRFSW